MVEVTQEQIDAARADIHLGQQAKAVANFPAWKDHIAPRIVELRESYITTGAMGPNTNISLHAIYTVHGIDSVLKLLVELQERGKQAKEFLNQADTNPSPNVG